MILKRSKNLLAFAIRHDFMLRFTTSVLTCGMSFYNCALASFGLSCAELKKSFPTQPALCAAAPPRCSLATRVHYPLSSGPSPVLLATRVHYPLPSGPSHGSGALPPTCAYTCTVPSSSYSRLLTCSVRTQCMPNLSAVISNDLLVTVPYSCTTPGVV